VPVLLDDASEEDVPALLRGVPRYQPGDQDGYDALYRRLTGQPRIEPGALGDIRRLPPRKIEPTPLPERRDDAGRRRVTGRTLAFAAALVVLVTIALLWATRAPAVYTVRVAVLDPHGRPVENAAVTSSVGGDVMASNAGWQIVIPAASRPADGRVTVRASAPAAFLQGEAEVRLGRSATVTTTVQMTKRSDARVRGYAIDTAQRRLAGVRVSVAGVAGEVVTGDDGSFSLPAQAADGQQVQILAEKDGYRPLTLWHPAGDEPAVLVLERLPEDAPENALLLDVLPPPLETRASWRPSSND
jgi:hypothetical protein